MGQVTFFHVLFFFICGDSFWQERIIQNRISDASWTNNLGKYKINNDNWNQLELNGLLPALSLSLSLSLCVRVCACVWYPGEFIYRWCFLNLKACAKGYGGSFLLQIHIQWRVVAEKLRSRIFSWRVHCYCLSAATYARHFSLCNIVKSQRCAEQEILVLVWGGGPWPLLDVKKSHRFWPFLRSPVNTPPIG